MVLRQVEVRAMVWKEEDREDYMVQCQRKADDTVRIYIQDGGVSQSTAMFAALGQSAFRPNVCIISQTTHQVP